MILTRLRDVPRWFLNGIVVLLVVLLLAVLLARTAVSAPKANNDQECRIVADMAVTAAALVSEDVDRERADRIMPRIYFLPDERAGAMLRAILDAAYRDKPDPELFASALLNHCVRYRGNMDAILGADS